MPIDLWEDPSLNNSWKRKLASLGYTHKPLNLYKIEGQCPMCGHGNYLFQLSGTFDCCQRCFKHFHNYNNVGARVSFSTSLGGTQCRLCKSMNFMYVHVNRGKFCAKCYWSKLGWKGGRLKTPDGSRV